MGYQKLLNPWIFCTIRQTHYVPDRNRRDILKLKMETFSILFPFLSLQTSTVSWSQGGFSARVPPARIAPKLKEQEGQGPTLHQLWSPPEDTLRRRTVVGNCSIELLSPARPVACGELRSPFFPALSPSPTPSLPKTYCVPLGQSVSQKVEGRTCIFLSGKFFSYHAHASPEWSVRLSQPSFFFLKSSCLLVCIIVLRYLSSIQAFLFVIT